MRFFDPGYFKSVGVKRGKIARRTISDRLVAWELDAKYYDGSRNTGYGGYHYQPERWHSIVDKVFGHFGLVNGCSIIDVGCKKGFFGRAVIEKYPECKVIGLENHPYPLRNHEGGVNQQFLEVEYYDLDTFSDSEFDLVWSFSAIYMQNLGNVVRSLRQFERIGKNKFVTLGAFSNEDEEQAFVDWTLIGTTVLSEDEWLEVMRWSGYRGDYFFTTPKALGLL